MQSSFPIIVNVITATSGGGAEFLVKELHNYLLDKNFDCHTIYFQGQKSLKLPNKYFLNINVRSPMAIFKIRSIIKNLQANCDCRIVLHAHLTWPFLYCPLATLGLKNITLIYTEHSTYNKRRKIPFLWIFEKLIYRKYHFIIGVSEGVSSSLRNWLKNSRKERFLVIDNGAKLYELTKRKDLNGRLPKIVSVGSLTKTKNFSKTIEAISGMESEIDEYIIVGEGPERSRLEALIEDNNLESKVFLVGWSENVEYYLRNADLQLIPSLWEGFGLVAVEGMSTGLPVIASDVDGLREVIGGSSSFTFLVPQSASASAWRHSIRQLIKNLCSSHHDCCHNQVRAQAEKFTINKMAEQYINLYMRS